MGAGFFRSHQWHGHHHARRVRQFQQAARHARADEAVNHHPPVLDARHEANFLELRALDAEAVIWVTGFNDLEPLSETIRARYADIIADRENQT